MKHTLLIGMSVLLSLTFSSCKDDACDCNGQLIGMWEADVFMSLESVGYPKDDNYSPLIEFKSDGSYDLLLDVNACGGEYSLSVNDSISISSPGCTKICCDSEFSVKLSTMLPQVSTYTITGDELQLSVSGWGWIALNRISE
ncbi:META domain-containing protein [Draconibacterium sp. IB214405]|uniref:META domain-containing protein n=1 Tax=Draconibacterium sp. IB214405 TaxID=3097352 RepID=UPI002A0B60B9|nr:META domain-containing protein [Draconibacterium sp. IB214405]MDX8337609.1 META domain-containing protein [Draconibacterium sp. IB214405]